jgi:hypothetical protein
MKVTPKETMLDACRAMLGPIVRLLLKNGVTWKEFADLSKSVFVDVAGQDYGIGGRPTNASRVSILTGLTRREVKRQRDLLDAGAAPAPTKTGNAMRLLSGWFQDPAFSDDGAPRILARDGEGVTFHELHKRYGGDIPAVALLKELLKTGAVEETGGGVRAVSRYYMPDPLDPESVLRTGEVVADLGRTVAWNLTREPEEPTRFEGRATEPRVPSEHLPAFRDFLEQEGQAFLERTDRWLHEHQCDTERSTNQRTTRMGVGVYMVAGSGGRND